MEISNPKHLYNKLGIANIRPYFLPIRISNILYNNCLVLSAKNNRINLRCISCFNPTIFDTKTNKKTHSIKINKIIKSSRH